MREIYALRTLCDNLRRFDSFVRNRNLLIRALPILLHALACLIDNENADQDQENRWRVLSVIYAFAL